MRRKTGQISFEYCGYWYWANRSMTSCWRCPEGLMGERERLKKADFLEWLVAYKGGTK